MALSNQLLEKLACPKCKGKLNYLEVENQLLCESCRLSYRITDDIPVLLIDEAEKYE
ncbi:MAG: Trm112 family protein [candidate division Zixibacteria bacterium]|nr:Trm112 family protein [candidate division Zixibacteria bacterium]MDH3936821.1 Trm112 family protein [candidate division Zixibacteria bacterium]MDH4033886.1 Trm112 family protein [candidate division Zixibacteria bacterium]